MNGKRRRNVAAAGGPLLVAGLLVAYGLAQSGSWDAPVSGPTGGGARSIGGQYALEGVIGQPFLGTSSGQSGTGPVFSLDAGILGGVSKAVAIALRIPLVAKD